MTQTRTYSPSLSGDFFGRLSQSSERDVEGEFYDLIGVSLYMTARFFFGDKLYVLYNAT
jgi:hypothetical protein